MRDRCPSLAVAGALLSLAVVGAVTPLGAAAVSLVGAAHLPPPGLPPTPIVTISLASVAGAAEMEQRAAIAAAQLDHGLHGVVRNGTPEARRRRDRGARYPRGRRPNRHQGTTGGQTRRPRLQATSAAATYMTVDTGASPATRRPSWSNSSESWWPSTPSNRQRPDGPIIGKTRRCDRRCQDVRALLRRGSRARR